MQSSIRHIYVALPDQGPDRWRRVEAVPEGEDAYRIISTNDRPGERWEYDTGAIVRCRAATLASGERVLVATERLSSHQPPRPSEDAEDAPGW